MSAEIRQGGKRINEAFGLCKIVRFIVNNSIVIAH